MYKIIRHDLFFSVRLFVGSAWPFVFFYPRHNGQWLVLIWRSVRWYTYWFSCSGHYSFHGVSFHSTFILCYYTLLILPWNRTSWFMNESAKWVYEGNLWISIHKAIHVTYTNLQHLIILAFNNIQKDYSYPSETINWL